MIFRELYNVKQQGNGSGFEEEVNSDSGICTMVWSSPAISGKVKLSLIFLLSLSRTNTQYHDDDQPTYSRAK